MALRYCSAASVTKSVNVLDGTRLGVACCSTAKHGTHVKHIKDSQLALLLTQQASSRLKQWRENTAEKNAGLLSLCAACVHVHPDKVLTRSCPLPDLFSSCRA